eukprot:4813951-Pleurochrysis_carterae.AAC.2
MAECIHTDLQIYRYTYTYMYIFIYRHAPPREQQHTVPLRNCLSKNLPTYLLTGARNYRARARSTHDGVASQRASERQVLRLARGATEGLGRAARVAMRAVSNAANQESAQPAPI